MMYPVILFIPLVVLWVPRLSSVALPQPLPLNSGLNTEWNPFQAFPNLYGPRQCHPIPEDMKLCQSVGYNQMVLPNFLDHEDVKEAITQSNMWMTLAKTKCHPDLNRFLCSLYAPVCLKGHQGEKIQPCFRLCKDVKQACEPRMNSFGYAWPKIVQCDQFPKQSNMCIPLTQKQSRACPPCEPAVTYESLVSSFCLADTVIRAKIPKIKERDSTLQIMASKSVKFLKPKGVSKLSNKLELPCTTCSSLKNLDRKTRYLVMGNRDSDQTIKVIFVAKWDKKNPEFMRAMKAIRTKDKNLCKPHDIDSERPKLVPATTTVARLFRPTPPSHSKIRPPRNQVKKPKRNKDKKGRNKNRRKNRNKKNNKSKRRKGKKNRRRRKKNPHPKGSPKHEEWKRLKKQRRRDRRRRRRLNQRRTTLSPSRRRPM